MSLLQLLRGGTMGLGEQLSTSMTHHGLTLLTFQLRVTDGPFTDRSLDKQPPKTDCWRTAGAG
jgi:hypothetical protein